jgi:hypothetical protein
VYRLALVKTANLCWLPCTDALLQELVEVLTAVRHGLTTVELALMLHLICLLRACISFSVDGYITGHDFVEYSGSDSLYQNTAMAATTINGSMSTTESVRKSNIGGAVSDTINTDEVPLAAEECLLRGEVLLDYCTEDIAGMSARLCSQEKIFVAVDRLPRTPSLVRLSTSATVSAQITAASVRANSSRNTNPTILVASLTCGALAIPFATLATRRALQARLICQGTSDVLIVQVLYTL